MAKNDYGLQQLLEIIKPADYQIFEYPFKEESEEYRIENSENPKFISPILKVVSDYTTVADIKDARIILIEAVGASGKTELTKNMSYKLKCPIVDLGKTSVVAGYSLTGLLNKRMKLTDYCSFMGNISQGKSTLIIDALDEGFMKTNYQGYLAFLDDVISLESTSNCPIIMLGRYNAVELAASYFATEANIDVATLKIEPFTLKQAQDFIDNAGDKDSQRRHYQIYSETRDYILTTIDGFFQNQSEIKTEVSQRFIGYAPVLLSIAEFFKNNNNYASTLQELKEKNAKSVSLIVDIVERILKRDRDEKVHPQLLEMLLIGRTEDFQRLVQEKTYTDEEQCARVLYKIMGEPFPEIEVDDAAFLSKYDEHINTWIDEHPFLGKKRFNNIVFESYALARLVNNEKYKDEAFRYIKKFGVSYMFAYIYHAIYGFNNLDKSVFRFIYESIRELNTKQNYYTLNLDYNSYESNEEVFKYDVEFVGSNEQMQSYEGSYICRPDDMIDLGPRLEHLYISTPGDFLLSHRNMEVSAPSYINCRKMIIESEELTVCCPGASSNIMFECEEAVISQKYEQYLQICGPGKTSGTLQIVSQQQPQYPLIEHHIESVKKLKGLSEETITRYKKLRSIILSFRSHSKHELAKHRERIDFVMGNNDAGRAVIKALLDKNIMHLKKNYLYVLDPDVMDVELGLSYDGIRNFEYSKEVVNFLESIKQ